MCKIVFSLFFLISGSTAWGQQGNYIYMDAETGQPFYVKIKDRIHSSSQSGYIIITGIKENSLDVNIGFPADIYPEQHFVLPLNNNDQGFHLKNTDDAGWELVNLKTQAVIKNNNPEKAKDDTNLIRKTDAFSVMLSRVVNDPAVLIAGSKLKATSSATAIVPPVIAEPEPVKTVAVKPDTVVAGIPAKPDTIIASVPVKQDTVIAKMPVKPDTLLAVHKKIDSVARKEAVVSTPMIAQEPIKIDKPAIVANPVPVRKLFDRQFEKVYEAAYVDGKNDTVRISYPINIDIPAQKPEAAGCRFTANDQDVDNLRVKILEGKSTDERIATSKVFFQSKCFTVKQIKALSELFDGDEDKYRLFDTAYPYTADSSNFPSLISLLKDDYYRNRFKAIIRK